MAAVSVLSPVAEQLEALLRQRRDADDDKGTAQEALQALREAAKGSLGEYDLSTMAETLDALVGMADLRPPEHHVLALAVLANLDDRIGRAVGLLHDDVSRTRPSVGLAARVLESLVGRDKAAEAAALDSALVRLGLVTHAGSYGDLDAPVANREIVLHPRVLALLLNGGPLKSPDPRLAGALHVERVPGLPVQDEARPADTEEPALAQGGILDRLKALPNLGRVAGLLCVGPDVDAPIRLARPFARRYHLRLLRVDIAGALALGETPESLVCHVRRESMVLEALPVWTHLPGRDALSEPQLARRVARMLAMAPAPLLVHSEYLWTPPGDLPLVLIHLATPGPTFPQRVMLWRASDGRTRPADRDTAIQLATAFVLPPMAVSAARVDADATAQVLELDHRAELRRAAHRQAAARLVRFATKITPKATWDDLVTPPSVTRQLREIEWRAAHRARVLEDAGFRGRRGFLALLAGPSGTGKTLAAEIIAGAQGFDLYKVDLAALVSKFIGDTEKNLAQIFEDAESAHAILFFDEADAVFGKRSEVRDSHDRYANQEVNYLLQRVEAYEGVIILATNLRQNMDDAFLRRLDLVVDLPFPDEDARTEIWRRVWPGTIEVAEDVDLAEFGRRFRFAGGSIRNTAVDATFRAVARQGEALPIRVERMDIILAVGREYQKLGRPITRGDFGEDYAAVIETLFTTVGGEVHVA